MSWFRRRDRIAGHAYVLGTTLDPSSIPPPHPWDAYKVICHCGAVTYHPQSCEAGKLKLGTEQKEEPIDSPRLVESFARSMETFEVDLLADVGDAIDERLPQVDRKAAWERAIERDPTMAVAALLALFEKAAPVLGDALCDRVRTEVDHRRSAVKLVSEHGPELQPPGGSPVERCYCCIADQGQHCRHCHAKGYCG